MDHAARLIRKERRAINTPRLERTGTAGSHRAHAGPGQLAEFVHQSLLTFPTKKSCHPVTIHVEIPMNWTFTREPRKIATGTAEKNRSGPLACNTQLSRFCCRSRPRSLWRPPYLAPVARQTVCTTLSGDRARASATSSPYSSVTAD